MRTVQSRTCELGYGADTMFHRTYFLLEKRPFTVKFSTFCSLLDGLLLCKTHCLFFNSSSKWLSSVCNVPTQWRKARLRWAEWPVTQSYSSPHLAVNRTTSLMQYQRINPQKSIHCISLKNNTIYSHCWWVNCSHLIQQSEACHPTSTHLLYQMQM